MNQLNRVLVTNIWFEIFKQTDEGNLHIDFKDENALKTLTKCLLERDFNLTVHLPPKQLVPTLPLRLNYILWIEDIVKKFQFDNIIGLDIGKAEYSFKLSSNRVQKSIQIDSLSL